MNAHLFPIHLLGSEVEQEEQHHLRRGGLSIWKVNNSWENCSLVSFLIGRMRALIGHCSTPFCYSTAMLIEDWMSGYTICVPIAMLTCRSLEDGDMLFKMMYIIDILDCLIPLTYCCETLRNRAEQLSFFDGKGQFGDSKLKRNRGDMVIPVVFHSRSTTRSKTIESRVVLMRMV